MGYDFEGCEHILQELYSYAKNNGLSSAVVDYELWQGYWQHRHRYDKLSVKQGFEIEARRRGLDMHVLDDHVRSALEKIVRGK